MTKLGKSPTRLNGGGLVLLYVASIIILSACKAPTWTGRPASEWKKDEYECDREVSGQRDPMFQADMWRRCMELRGWRRS